MEDDNPGSSFRRWLLGSQINVLLIGASTDLAAVSGQLSKVDYRVGTARDSHAALTMLDQEPFDVLIVDWGMAGDEGKRLCAALRSSSQHSDVYAIAMLSAGGAAPDQALRAGADDYLVSPFGEAELLARVRAGSRSALLDVSEERVQALIANVPGAIYRCAADAEWTMELISEDIERISGYPPSDFIDSSVRSFASIIHPDDREQVEDNVARAIREGRIFALEYRITRADGSLAWVLDRGQEAHTSTGRSWLDGVVFDITDRKLAEEQASRSQRLLAVAEDRQRIAEDLHDGVIQCLFGVSFNLDALRKKADYPDEVRSSLAANIDRLNAVIDDVRQYVHGLRPTLLADRELSEALDILVRDFQDGSGIAMAIDLDLDVCTRLAPHAPDVVQMAREALSNVQRHARAVAGRVSLSRAGDDALLVIDDNGCGFDPLASAGRGRGLGNLADRSKKLGGQLTINRKAAGSSVQIRIPLGITDPSAEGPAASDLPGSAS
jgi:PAS domain S-box-containing protein